mmetsp:Transcript_7939/g.9289  ORF Transcript_7939/g.9289 Transcript_7939/m.9289 type:complete len:172 (+) Transcript_7939:288-803(+)
MVTPSARPAPASLPYGFPENKRSVSQPKKGAQKIENRPNRSEKRTKVWYAQHRLIETAISYKCKPMNLQYRPAQKRRDLLLVCRNLQPKTPAKKLGFAKTHNCLSWGTGEKKCREQLCGDATSYFWIRESEGPQQILQFGVEPLPVYPPPPVARITHDKTNVVDGLKKVRS